MGRIVREHYPVDKLPEDFRHGLAAGGDVRVIVEEMETCVAVRSPDVGNAAAATRPVTGAAPDDLFARRHPIFASGAEADAHVRSMRAEWG